MESAFADRRAFDYTRAMKLATWNINSARAREARLVQWLEKHDVDVLCLQEIKTPTDQFPYDAMRAAGYSCAVHGQRTYNGVAILSRVEASEVTLGFGDDVDDPQARVISANIGGVLVISAYFPNGKTVGAPEFDYKLEWMTRLLRYLERTADPAKPLILAGDFNVAPYDTDAAEPARWADSVLCHESVRRALDRIRDWGFVDVFHQHHPHGGIFSWWDYRMLAFPKNLGLRIDHVFATCSLAQRCTAVSVDREERKKGTVDKPSDHAPVIAEFTL